MQSSSSPLARIDQCRLLVVRSGNCAHEAYRDVGKYLGWRRGRSPETPRSPAPPMIGTWTQSATTDLPPDHLGLELKSDQRVFRFRESIGVNGKWALWWLDVVDVPNTTASETLRESMLASLCKNLREAEPRFTPVFDIEERQESIRKETSRLDGKFSEFVLPALILDTERGTVSPESQMWGTNG